MHKALLALLAALPASAQIMELPAPEGLPLGGPAPIEAPAMLSREEPLPAMRGLTAAASEGALPEAPLPPQAEPARADRVERSAPARAEAGIIALLGRLEARAPLTASERGDFDQLMEAAVEIAFDARRDLGERQDALTFITQAGLLSIHDLATRRLAEDRLVRLKFSLCRLRMDAEKAYGTLLLHMFAPMDAQTRRWVYDSLLHSRLLHRS